MLHDVLQSCLVRLIRSTHAGRHTCGTADTMHACTLMLGTGSEASGLMGTGCTKMVTDT